MSDTGAGMPPEVLEHMFEPFFTTKEVGKGTGLGLAQVYGIVKQHEGYVEVSSRPGEGTAFTIYLPALETTGALPIGRAEPEIVEGNGETILVVEDEERVRALLVHMLEALNYRVLTAANGEEALEVYDGNRDHIALVLTDMVMPVMGGRELQRRLRRRAPELPVVLTSGYPLRGEREDAFLDDFADWIQKPPSLSALAGAIAKALKSSGA